MPSLFRSLGYALCGVFIALCAGCGGASSSNTAPPQPSPSPAPASTSTVLSVSQNPAPANATVVLTANVTASSGTLAGNVTFLDGTTSLGSASLSGSVATLSVSSFAPSSTHSLTASFSGSSSFAASTSTIVTLTIGAAPTPVTITAHSSFSFSVPNQTIAGFGGAEAFYLNYLDSHPNQSQIYTALFDPVNGLGLTFLRLQNLYYQYNGSNASSFDPDTPQVVKAANTAHGSNLTLLMSSWSPPASIKSNGSVNNGGTLNTVSGGYNYAGFAQFWYNSLVAYAALGVTPSYISIQNEPDFTATYASCRFNPTEATFQGTNYAGYDKAFAAVYSEVQGVTSPPKLIGPESFSTANALTYASALETESPDNSEIAGIAHHLYNVSSSDPDPDDGVTALQNLEAQYPSALKLMTEYYDAPGFNTAWNIHNALTVANDNAYLYWGLAWPSSPVANGQATDQQGLLYIDNPYASTSSWAFVKGWAYNDAYYAMKHFSYYIRPGYVRYNATVDNPDERVSVYQSADQKTTIIVVLNLSATTTDGFALNLSNVSYSNSVVYRSTFSSPITTGERWANLGAYSSTGLSLPPQAVATIVLTQ